MKNTFIKNIREFNRFYTDFLGSLNKKILNSKYSLPEARVLFEINNSKVCSAKDIVSTLNIDKSYLSRILKKLQRDKLIYKKKSDEDARNYYLMLSDSGKQELDALESSVSSRINELYDGLSETERKTLEQSMLQIKKILTGK